MRARIASRALRHVFVGSERAGKRAAAIQSLLYTAKLNGLDPSAWLRETLENTASTRSVIILAIGRQARQHSVFGKPRKCLINE
jgi:hypothetical protein